MNLEKLRGHKGPSQFRFATVQVEVNPGANLLDLVLFNSR
jgi:hypothetical protein